MEINRDQIREIVKEEFYKILFEERIFEREIKTYIKSLAYDDVHYLRLLNLGLVKNSEEVYELSESSSGSLKMRKKRNISLENIYNENIKYGIMTGNLKDFISAINYKAEGEVIDWRQKAKKGFTYTGIFEMYQEIYDIDFNTMNQVFVNRFTKYLSVKFKLGGEHKKWTYFKKSFMKIYQPKKNKS